jgi:hypothetical protein
MPSQEGGAGWVLSIELEDKEVVVEERSRTTK